MGQFIKVAQKGDIPPGKSVSVEVNGQQVALFNFDGTYYAIGDTCTHRGGPLSEGDLDGKVVSCPWHGATFDVTTGDVQSPPAPEGVGRFEIQVDGEEIRIEVP